MNDAVLNGSQPAGDEYARFCLECGTRFVEKRTQARRYQYCKTHRGMREVSRRQVAERIALRIERQRAKALRLAIPLVDDYGMAPDTGIAIPRTCENPACRRPFLARLPPARYCDLWCWESATRAARNKARTTEE